MMLASKGAVPHLRRVMRRPSVVLLCVLMWALVGVTSAPASRQGSTTAVNPSPLQSWLAGGESLLWRPLGGAADPRTLLRDGIRRGKDFMVRRVGTRRIGVTPATGSRGRVGRHKGKRNPGARGRPVTPRRLQAAGIARGPAASTINWQGFPNRLIPAVGLLVIRYPNGVGTCTATVITRTLVLTAAHCVYNRKAGGEAQSFAFAPGLTWDNLDAKTYRTPYGIWAAGSQNWWAPRGYLDRLDPGLDFALVEFGPQPGWLSSTTGSFTASWNLRYTRVRQYIVGYPSDGFWSTRAGAWGFGQYACDSTYDGNWERLGSGYLLWTACTMNRGSSGGPWFIQLSNGTWTIGAVTSQCSGPVISADKYCVPWSNYSRGSYLNDNFRAFWRSVQPRLHW